MLDQDSILEPSHCKLGTPQSVSRILSSNLPPKLIILWRNETEAVRGVALSGADNTAKKVVASWISALTTLSVSVPGYFEGACAKLTLGCHSTAY